MHMKLKKGDTVTVSVGRDRGKKGKVDSIDPKTAMITVAGVGMVKRHMKRRDEKNPGGIIDIVKPIHASKVALVCPSCGKPTRIGINVSGGDRTRICRKCGKKI
jgi:large subunit ribosomal protein L24